MKLNWINIKSALVYGVLSALLAMVLYVTSVGDIFKVSWQALVNSGVFGFLIVLVSLLKNLLTTDSGNFLGIIRVIPDVEKEK